MAELQIGGVHVQRDAALQLAHRYLTAGRGWAYPSYDGYAAAHARGPLVDGDLLAPVLLNVRQLSITTYEELQEARPRLQSLLDRIPERQSLADAGREDFELIGELFGVVDDRAIRGARGTVISKVLHRKRPDFIPLYDLRVGAVYQHGPDAPVPVVKHRPWREFAPLFAAAIQADLRREAEFWGQVSALASEPAITPLRALDIVAWSVSPVARGKKDLP